MKNDLWPGSIIEAEGYGLGIKGVGGSGCIEGWGG